MKSLIFLTLIMSLLWACSSDETPAQSDKNEDLIEIKNGIYTEYYPGKEQVKIQGEQTEEGQRNGRWVYYSPLGKELSYTFFQNGKKHGISYNSYPNGMPYYYGEYHNDTMVGVWKTYDTIGRVEQKDFGYPDNY